MRIIKNHKKTLLTIAVALIIVTGAGVLALNKLTSDLCGNEIMNETLSPDGHFKALVFQRDCGATTGFTTQISLLPSNVSLPNEAGNIFIVDGHPNDR